MRSSTGARHRSRTSRSWPPSPIVGSSPRPYGPARRLPAVPDRDRGPRGRPHMTDTVASRQQVLLWEGEVHDLGPSAVPGLVSVEGLATATGWDLRPEGLCNGDACVPVRDRAAAVPFDGQIDLAVVAPLLDRPVVVDAEAGVIAVGAPRQSRREALVDRKAPDFTLPGLDGTDHSL